jgi:hypothetical protein
MNWGNMKASAWQPLREHIQRAVRLCRQKSFGAMPMTLGSTMIYITEWHWSGLRAKAMCCGFRTMKAVAGGGLPTPDAIGLPAMPMWFSLRTNDAEGRLEI